MKYIDVDELLNRNSIINELKSSLNVNDKTEVSEITKMKILPTFPSNQSPTSYIADLIIELRVG